MEIREQPLHTAADLTRETRTLTVVEAASGAAEVPRFDGARDRLYTKFVLAAATTHQPLGDAQCVTDFSALPVRTQSLQRPDSKKGPACIVDNADLAATGARQVNQNIDIAQLIDLSPAAALTFDFEGRKVGLRAAAVAALDGAIKAHTEMGLGINGILLNYVRKPTGDNPRSVGSPLVHPPTPVKDVPTGVVAFNTATTEGLFLYRAIPLDHRPLHPARREVRTHGRARHWQRSPKPLGLVRPRRNQRRRGHPRIQHRTAHRRPRCPQRPPRFPHLHFAGAPLDAPRRQRRRLARNARRPPPHGPRFWNDKTAPLRLDAPRITFHNLEVLPAFLYAGQPRRIALTEQGFHCPKGADGEAAQAYAWKRVQALPEVESFIYHRHVDHLQEGGLLLGLREHDAKVPHTLGRKRLIWDVFQKAGTPEEDAAFAFALPIVGRKNWSNIVATQLDNSPASPARVTTGVIYDFVANRRAAKVDNTLALEFKRVLCDASWMATALQQHPNPHGLSRATWRVAVPAEKLCVLRYTALLNHAESQGAGFAVKIDGQTVFDKKVTANESERAAIDLAPWAGREAAFDFLIDPLDRN